MVYIGASGRHLELEREEVLNIFDNSHFINYSKHMSPILELGAAIQIRRTDMGLTQTGLAKLGGLSRATVNQIENGAVNDLSLIRAARLLSVLGLTVNVSSPRPKPALKTKVASKSPALELAARTSSVSYAIPLPARQLRDALVSGNAPARFEPHMATLLDEAPVSLLAAVVEQVHTEKNVARTQLWKHLRTMAKSLKSDREIWK